MEIHKEAGFYHVVVDGVSKMPAYRDAQDAFLRAGAESLRLVLLLGLPPPSDSSPVAGYQVSCSLHDLRLPDSLVDTIVFDICHSTEKSWFVQRSAPSLNTF